MAPVRQEEALPESDGPALHRRQCGTIRKGTDVLRRSGHHTGPEEPDGRPEGTGAPRTGNGGTASFPCGRLSRPGKRPRLSCTWRRCRRSSPCWRNGAARDRGIPSAAAPARRDGGPVRLRPPAGPACGWGCPPGCGRRHAPGRWGHRWRLRARCGRWPHRWYRRRSGRR